MGSINKIPSINLQSNTTQLEIETRVKTILNTIQYEPVYIDPDYTLFYSRNEISNYTQKGSRNSSRLLNRFGEENGYLVLYTELDTHIEIGDIVYITKFSGISSLDNFNDFKLDDNYPYTNFNQGYIVLNVEKDKNKIVINKLFKDTELNLNLTNHYISLVKGISGKLTQCTVNASIWENCELLDCNVIQGIFVNGSATGTTLRSKYTQNYESLRRLLTDDGLAINKNNYTFGYSFLGNMDQNSYVLNTNIENGNFNNCTIVSQDIQRTITDGYFSGCTISNYIINGGVFIDCIIESNCIWNYGQFDNKRGDDFKPAIWKNGIWSKGNFSGKTWENGTFNGDPDSLFINSTWNNGVFNNGIVSGISWLDGFFNNGTFTYSTWSGGTLNNGTVQNSIWYLGTFNNGNIINCTWYGGEVKNGNITGTWFGGKFYNGYMTDSIWSGGTFYNGTMENTTWWNGTWYNGTMNNCTWYNGTWYNGTMNKSIWSGGTWKDGIFTNGTWYTGTWDRGNMSNSNVTNINWLFGYMNSCTLDSLGTIIWTNGVMENTSFIGRNTYTTI